MKKIISVILLSLLLSGCSAEYNVEILNNLSVIENNTILGDSGSIGQNYTSTETGIMAQINNYYYYDDFNKYTYEIFNDDIYAGATFFRNYNHLEEWVDSYFIKTIFNTGIISYDDNMMNIIFDLNSVDGYLSSNLSDPNFYLSSVLINIKLPFKVISGNYDSINNDTITWNYSYKNKKDELTFTFDTSLSTDGTKIETTNNNNILNKANENNFNIVYILITFFVIILIGTLAIYTIYLKKNKV